MGMAGVAIFSDDDAESLHRFKADESIALDAGAGVPAYLNIDAVIAAAKKANCDAIHPVSSCTTGPIILNTLWHVLILLLLYMYDLTRQGYGFLAENPVFAARCEQEGIIFVGPTSETIALFGDKTQARALASKVGVSLLPGTLNPVDLAEATDFFSSLPAGASLMLKAVAGGGGRGMRAVHSAAELPGNQVVFVVQFVLVAFASFNLQVVPIPTPIH